MIETVESGETLVIKPNCDIVASQVEAFRSALHDKIEQGYVNLAIDLSTVGMIDSKGLAVFMLCQKTLQGRNGRLVVLTDNKDYQQLFRVMRMDEHFTVTDSLQA